MSKELTKKEKYQRDVQQRLSFDQKNKKYEKCSSCGLKIKASGKTPEECIENHQAGYHCASTSKKQSSY